MKKVIIGIAALVSTLTASAQNGSFPLDSIMNPSTEFLSVSASVGFESQYMFRAEKCAGYSIQPEVELGYSLAGFDVYGGAWNNTPLKGANADNLQEVDLYTGASYTYQSLRLDVGYVYYWYPAYEAGELSRDMEVYIGASLDTSAYLNGINLNPSVYYFYNWILKQQVIETSVGYDAPVGAWTFGWEKLTMPVNVYCGYVTAGRVNGDGGSEADVGRSYWYWGASIDVAYAVTEYCTLSAGARYSQSFDNNTDNEDYIMNTPKNFWYGVKVAFGF